MLRKYTLSGSDELPIEVVLAVEDHVFPADWADVLQQGQVQIRV